MDRSEAQQDRRERERSFKKGMREGFLSQVKLWKTVNGDVYADVLEGGRVRTYYVNGNAFLGWLAERADGAVSMPWLEDLQKELFVQGLHSAAVRPVFVRVGQENGELFYDLGGEQGTVVASGGWEVGVKRPEVGRFVSSKSALPQVIPKVTGRSLEEVLGPFLHLKSQDDLLLIVSWLLGAMKPDGPFPILVINGEQGSAKTTTTRVLKKIIDPSGIDMRQPPEGLRDFVAGVRGSYVLAYDNISFVPAWLSDALCRVSTGGGIGGRQLYTDADEASFSAYRPVILNGIPQFIEREDLADRTIIVTLDAIEPSKRMDDDTFWAQFHEALPEIFGALLNLAGRAQKNFPDTQLVEKPRMSNFARWCVAGGLGEEFLRVYNANRREASENSIEHDPVAQAVISYLQERPVFNGTLFNLLRVLVEHSPVTGKGWPETSAQLQNRLRRLAPVLKAIGVEIYKAGREGGTGRTMVEIRKNDQWGSTGHAVSAGKREIVAH